MAGSSAHRAGQIVGNVLEEAFYYPLKQIADEYGLYLDYQHERPARGGRKFVRWTTTAGTHHNLDFVFERDGSEEQYGEPVAFIEIAWRRYTKHSRNKAGEISGALVPLARTHSDSQPFLGVIIAGAWTQGGLNDFKGNGIQVLHLESDVIVNAFSEADIDFSFGEDTLVDAIDRALAADKNFPAPSKNPILSS